MDNFVILIIYEEKCGFEVEKSLCVCNDKVFFGISRFFFIFDVYFIRVDLLVFL